MDLSSFLKKLAALWLFLPLNAATLAVAGAVAPPLMRGKGGHMNPRVDVLFMLGGTLGLVLVVVTGVMYLVAATRPERFDLARGVTMFVLFLESVVLNVVAWQ
jgi:hypothetical protein